MKKLIGLCSLIAIIIMAIFCFCGCDFLAYPSDNNISSGNTDTDGNQTPETPPGNGETDKEPDTPAEPEPEPEPEPGEPDKPTEPEPEPGENPGEPTPPEPDGEPDIPDIPQPPEIKKYTVIFMDGNKTVDKFEAEENSTISPRPVTETAGYIFVGWEKDGKLYDFSLPVTSDLTLRARREAVTYTVTFISDGAIIAQCPYTVENRIISEPEIPAKEHYTAVWDDYVLEIGDITVQAIYTPIEYTVTFVAGGEVISVQTYTAENTSVTEPEIPSKENYTGAWESYLLNFENITVNAVYSPVNYTVAFVADGITVSSCTYNVENTFIIIPGVPAKPGYTGEWEKFTLSSGNVTVNAVYTLITGTPGLKYRLTETSCAVIGYDGESARVTIPYYYYGLPVTEIAANAFFNSGDKLQSVILPESVITIGKYAFANCGLQEITIPEGVITVSQRAFTGCTELKSVTLSDTVTEIGEFAFYNCKKLENVRIGAGVNIIGNYAFYANNITSIVFCDPENWVMNDGSDQTPVPAEILSSPEDAAQFILKNAIYEYFKRV